MVELKAGPSWGLLFKGRRIQDREAPEKQRREGLEINGRSVYMTTSLAAFPSWLGGARMTRTHRASPSLSGMDRVFLECLLDPGAIPGKSLRPYWPQDHSVTVAHGDVARW